MHKLLSLNGNIPFQFIKLIRRGSQILLVTIILNGLAINTFSQPSPQEGNNFKNIPIPPSPNASSLGKFGDIPVSTSTGIPDISVPIYSYSDKQKDINLSVALRYHAGGHKVEDMASNVGLGWALNAGGVIMRTMKGFPDDEPNGYINTPPLPLLNTTNFDYISTEPSSSTPTNQGICLENSPSFFWTVKQIAENTYDGESDIFNLSVGTINEKFFLSKNKVPIFMTPNNLIVEVNYGTGGYSINGFTITDANGIKYFFNVPEYTQTDNVVEPSVPAPPMYTSAWYLSKVLSADGKDEIQFLYENTTSQLYENAFAISFKTTNPGGNSSLQTIQSYNTSYNYDAKRISKIVVPDKTTIDFSYTFNREDFVGDKALTSIKITSGQYERLFRLEYGYFLSDNCLPGQFCPPPNSPNNWYKRLKLNSIREESGQSIKPAYTFDYNNTKLPHRNSKDQDWWGFYNGGLTGDLMNNTPSFAVLGRDRVPSLSHCKAWVLEKITYPTGGSTQFTYELNEGVGEGVTKPIGGLRVQKIEDFVPESSATYTTTYQYTLPSETTSGLLITIPAYTAYWSVMTNPTIGKDIYFNESLNPTQTLSYNNGSPVIYTRVKEERLATGLSTGYKIYEFTPGASDQMHDNIYPFVQKQDLPWARGQLLRTSTYNSAGSLVLFEENEYQTTVTLPPTTDSSTRNLIVGNYQWDNQGTLNKYLYGARYYYLTRGNSQLIKTTREDYSGNEVKQTITDYTYDNTYHMLTSTKTTDSFGRIVEIKQYYPFHYNAADHPLMEEMVLKNRVAEIISTEEWITENQTKAVKSIIVNGYAIHNTDLLKKSKVSVLESTSLIPWNEIGEFSPINMYRSTAITERVNINKFDARGRGIQFKFESDETVSLVFGVLNEFPIARVNALSENVFHTSFEETGTQEVLPSSPAHTGTRFLNTGVYDFSSNGFVPVSITNLKISYWYWSGNKWNFSGVVAWNNSINAGSRLDEIRVFPGDSQMTTYTYAPGLGITSQTDANNVTTYYEYDPFGRLKLIKDADKNILKTYEYHYKGSTQPSN